MITKDDRIYIRITKQIKDDFEKVAEYRGLKSSGLLHSLIVGTINETKRETPEVFTTPAETPAATIKEADNDNTKKRGKKK